MKKLINLLSPRWIEERARRQQRRMNVTMLSVGILAIALWGAGAWMQVHAIDSDIAEARRELAPLQIQNRTLISVMEQKQELAKRSAMLDRLRESMPTTAVLALLTQLTPADIDVNNLTINVPDPVGLSTNNGRSQNAATSIRVGIEGTADDDVTIAKFVTTLTEHGATSNVRLEDSRKTVAGEKSRNAFRVSLEIPLYTSSPNDRRADS